MMDQEARRVIKQKERRLNHNDYSKYGQKV
jgi:hypothetical protein